VEFENGASASVRPKDAEALLYQPMNLIRSALRRSGAVAKRPCGSPSHSVSFAPAMLFAAARPAGWMGTVLSAVPWITRVGIMKDFRSGRKSVLPKASTHSIVALGLAQASARNLFKVDLDSAGNLPLMPGIFPEFRSPDRTCETQFYILGYQRYLRHHCDGRTDTSGSLARRASQHRSTSFATQ
jgi:hypothetical protein